MDPGAIYGRIKLNISQVERLTGVRKTTLRFWEKTFAEYLQVERSAGKQREYTPAAVEKVLTLRTLLRDEMYTIHGAKRRLGLLGDGEGGESDAGETGGSPPLPAADGEGT